MAKRVQYLHRILSWKPLLGVALLVCVGLLYVFRGTILPIAQFSSQPSSRTGTHALNTTVSTIDHAFTIHLKITPNRSGTNIFTVMLNDGKTGTIITHAGVSLYTTMLDMDMGTDSVNLQPDGKGHFSASGDLSMSGHWQFRVQVRMPDNTLHEATTRLLTPQ